MTTESAREPVHVSDLPELHNWTFVRLSFATSNEVIQAVAATGRAYKRANVYDGKLLLTTPLKSIDETALKVRTQNTTYKLVGPELPFNVWDKERRDFVRFRTGEMYNLPAEIAGADPFPTEFYVKITDPTLVQGKNTLLRLQRAIECATNIDNGLGGPGIPDISKLAALAKIAVLTPFVDIRAAETHTYRKRTSRSVFWNYSYRRIGGLSCRAGPSNRWHSLRSKHYRAERHYSSSSRGSLALRARPLGTLRMVRY